MTGPRLCSLCHTRPPQTSDDSWCRECTIEACAEVDSPEGRRELRRLDAEADRMARRRRYAR